MKSQKQPHPPREAQAILAHLSKPWACARALDLGPMGFCPSAVAIAKAGHKREQSAVAGPKRLRGSGRRSNREPRSGAAVPTQHADVAFTAATCFVLSEKGVARAARGNGELRPPAPQELAAGVACAQGTDLPSSRSANSENIVALGCRLPRWERESRALYWDRQIVKRLKQPSRNQMIVLMAFEEEDWPCRIADALPPTRGIDPKRRLHDTIKCLNRHQEQRLLHFSGDGSGEGVRWESLAAETLPIPAGAPLRVRAA